MLIIGLLAWQAKIDNTFGIWCDALLLENDDVNILILTVYNVSQAVDSEVSLNTFYKQQY